MRKITFGDRVRYQFDNVMAKGPVALIGWLFLLSATLILMIAVVVYATGIDPEERGFAEIAWASLLRTLDPGTMGGDTGRWPFLLAMLTVTMGGIFVVSMLIGVLTTGIEGRLEQLRKGRSFVAETGHTVILGWSPLIIPVVSDLVIANANQRRACIAILAEKDKLEMQDEIREKVGKTGHTCIVCRTGNPIDLTDLQIVNPHAARSIIILPPEDEEPDTYTLKVILALTNDPQRRPTPHHIVAILRDPRNLEATRLVGGDEVQLVLAGDLIARIAAQTCRQSGLSVLYSDLLDFAGDEIYFQEEPELVGKTFGQALLAYEDSAIIGLRFQDGRVQLNPPMDTRIGPGDQVIAISEDDDTVRLSGLTDYGIEADAIRAPEAQAQGPGPERTLILGWNRRAPLLLRELDSYVAPGSEVTVVAGDGRGKGIELPEIGGLKNLTVTFRAGDTTNRRVLDGLDIPTYHHVLVLSYADQLDTQQADARTLVTLLHLRDIAEKKGHSFSVVSEMLDVRNRDLAEVTQADDFIVSDRLVSLMLSQLAENRELSAVFEDLFNPEGSELYLKPAGQYVELGRPINFYTVVEAARRRGEIAVGYRLHAARHDPARAYGVQLNPDKSGRIAFSEQDRIIVLAEQ